MHSAWVVFKTTDAALGAAVVYALTGWQIVQGDETTEPSAVNLLRLVCEWLTLHDLQLLQHE